MLNLIGDIRISNQIADLEKCRFTHKIIMIGEPDKELMINFNAISGSLFMPPYEAVMEEMDGNLEAFRHKYFVHLFSAECQEYIALIFRAMYEGKRILLYLSKDESEMWYSKLFIEFMMTTFGLCISISDDQATFNMQYSDAVCDLLYLHDLFTYHEYFRNRNESLIQPIVMQKLVMEMNPYVPERTLENYQAYYTNFQKAVKSVPFNIVNGISFEEK